MLVRAAMNFSTAAAVGEGADDEECTEMASSSSGRNMDCICKRFAVGSMVTGQTTTRRDKKAVVRGRRLLTRKKLRREVGIWFKNMRRMWVNLRREITTLIALKLP